MGLPAFFARSATAAAQILSGYDPSLIEQKVGQTQVGIMLGTEVTESKDGLALADMLMRLLARLYPAITIHGQAGTDGTVSALGDIGRAINPHLALDENAQADFTIVIGGGQIPAGTPGVYLGCSGWSALISQRGPQQVEDSEVGIGAGAAACLGAANLFRYVFLGTPRWDPDEDSEVDLWGMHSAQPAAVAGGDELVLVGLGAIGESAAWALAHGPLPGLAIHLVDDESIDFGNLQRYVIALPGDVGKPKVSVAEAFLGPRFSVVGHSSTWESFASDVRRPLQDVLVAVDSAQTRRAVQASLPRWVANAWTQPGDVGASVHDFRSGACLRCIYLPKGTTPSDDQVVAEALRIPDQLMAVRNLLHNNEAVPSELLRLVAERFSLQPEDAQTFDGRPLRYLYAEGLCAGALIPLDATTGPIDGNFHVPLAHQSALGGLMLVAAWYRRHLDKTEGSAAVSMDVMRRVPVGLGPRPLQKDPRGICICQDPDYLMAYQNKFPKPLAGEERPAAAHTQSHV